MDLGFQCISIEKAAEIIQNENPVIVDIRDAGAYAQGHISEAILLTDENVDEFIAKTNKDKPILCYCYHGHSSRNAAAFLVEQGFENVYSIDGGYEEWKKQN